MVEVPLEIEAELPRDFDGAALLASSGLPRKVKIKAQRDALKLSTAYRADQLLADIVRTALRGTPQDAARVQEATRAFVRTVRERRQDGATLLVSSNGRGKIDVLEQLPERTPKAPVRSVPTSEPPRTTAQATLADRVAGLEKRLVELESAFARVAAGSGTERIEQLEARFSALQSRSDLAGPMIEAHAGTPPTMELQRTPGAPRRTTAVEAFAEGLRDELRARVTEQLRNARRATEICDKAAALAAEAESTLGAPRDGTAHRLRLTAAATAARMEGLLRVSQEVDLYQPADLPVAAQLVERLEDGPARIDTPDPATPLQLQAEALVRAARGPDAEERANWLRRAATLCGWTVIEPEVGGGVQPDLAQVIQGGGGGSSVVAVAAPGLRRNDGSVLVRARVLASVAEMADEEVEVLASTGGRESDSAAGAAVRDSAAGSAVRDSAAGDSAEREGAAAFARAPAGAPGSAAGDRTGGPGFARALDAVPPLDFAPSDSADVPHGPSIADSAALTDAARAEPPEAVREPSRTGDAGRPAVPGESATAAGVSAAAEVAAVASESPSERATVGDFVEAEKSATASDSAPPSETGAASAGSPDAAPAGPLAGAGEISPDQASPAAVGEAPASNPMPDEPLAPATAPADQVRPIVEAATSHAEEDDYQVSDVDDEEMHHLDLPHDPDGKGGG